MKRTVDTVLEFIQRTVKLDVAYYLSNAPWLFIRQIVFVLANLVLSVFLARFLSQETYGQYQYLLALAGMLAFFSIPGMNTAVFSAIVRGYEGSFSRGLRIRLTWSLLGVPVLLTISAYYLFVEQQTTLGWGVAILAVFFPIRSTFIYWTVLFQAKKDFQKYANYSSARVVLNAATVMTAVLIWPDQVIPLFLAYALSFGLVNAYLLRKSFLLIENDRQEKDWEKYGYFLTKVNILALLTGRLDQILVGTWIGVEQLAIYTIGLKFSLVIEQLTSELLTLTTPKIARSNTVDRRKYTFVFLVTMFCSLALIVITPFVIGLMFSDKYQESIPLAQMILAFLPFFVINDIYEKHFKYYLKSRPVILRSTVASPLVRAVLMIAFLYAFGVMGLAFMQGARSLIYILVLYFFARGAADEPLASPASSFIAAPSKETDEEADL